MTTYVTCPKCKLGVIEERDPHTTYKCGNAHTFQPNPPPALPKDWGTFS